MFDCVETVHPKTNFFHENLHEQNLFRVIHVVARHVDRLLRLICVAKSWRACCWHGISGVGGFGVGVGVGVLLVCISSGIEG